MNNDFICILSSRADIVIVKDNMVKCCIEVKKTKRTELTKARQYKKYNKLPIPTIYCLSKENIENTVNTVKEKMLDISSYILNSLYEAIISYGG